MWLRLRPDAADLPITTTPPFPGGHAWCIVWRLWGALFFAHCTDLPMQAQNPLFVKSNRSENGMHGVNKHIEPLLEHED